MEFFVLFLWSAGMTITTWSPTKKWANSRIVHNPQPMTSVMADSRAARALLLLCHQNQKNCWYWWGIKYHLFMPLPSGLLTLFLMWYQWVFKSLSSAYFSAKTTILCRNDILNVIFIDSFICIGGVDKTKVLIPSYVLLWKTVFFLISDGCEDICFSHFSCAKQISSYPSKAVPGFLDGATTSINNFFIVCVFYPKYFFISLSTQRWDSSIVRSCPALLSGGHGASPPPDQNQAKTRWVLGGSWVSAIAWVSARRIEPSEQQKHDEIALKTHLLFPCSPSRCT